MYPNLSNEINLFLVMNGIRVHESIYFHISQEQDQKELTRY